LAGKPGACASRKSIAQLGRELPLRLDLSRSSDERYHSYPRCRPDTY